MNKFKMGIGVAVVLGVAAISVGSALAFRGDPAVKGPNYSAERHTDMLKAFENKDYSAWQDLMQGRGRASEVVTEENFAKFVEAHDLMLQGQTAEAQKIREELGLGVQDGSGRDGIHMRMGGGMYGRGYNRDTNNQ